jgi:5-methylcytosine-specific restriction endonuclease McrA
VSRSAEAQEWRKLYHTPQWKALRKWRLETEPLCRSCKAQGRITPATVADHIRPHKGDRSLFFDPANIQSLCDEPRYRCHSSGKQSEEAKGYSKAVGLDGWPIDEKHPANRGGLLKG